MDDELKMLHFCEHCDQLISDHDYAYCEGALIDFAQFVLQQKELPRSLAELVPDFYLPLKNKRGKELRQWKILEELKQER